MKHTIILVDKKNNNAKRKFVVDVNWQSLISYAASEHMKYVNNETEGVSNVPPGIEVWETDNLVVHPKITPKTDYVKLACDLDVGDVIPFAQTVDGKEIKQKFAALNIIVESCSLPKDVSGFGAVKVVKINC